MKPPTNVRELRSAVRSTAGRILDSSQNRERALRSVEIVASDAFVYGLAKARVLIEAQLESETARLEEMPSQWHQAHLAYLSALHDAVGIIEQEEKEY